MGQITQKRSGRGLSYPTPGSLLESRGGSDLARAEAVVAGARVRRFFAGSSTEPRAGINDLPGRFPETLDPAGASACATSHGGV